MSNVRPELSTRNKYWIEKHRFYELKHFCLQYKEMKKIYSALFDLGVSNSSFAGDPKSNDIVDLTSTCAIRKIEISNKIKMIENTAMEADKELWFYILKAVTEGLSYTQLSMVYDIPCGRDTYYNRYRKFFWLLHNKKG